METSLAGAPAARASDRHLRIIITEFPKSGGSWVTGLVADALGVAKRDIYVADGFKHFDISRHPWYAGAKHLSLTPSCVIKSHERPDSPLIEFPAKYVHVVRDGRDVVVSKWFFESEFCVKNGIYKEFDVPFGQYVERTAREWRNYVAAWEGRTPHLCRYEDLLQDTAGELDALLSQLGLDVGPEAIERAVQANTREELRRAYAATFAHNTFVRKGVAGDWRNYFSRHDAETFHDIAGETLARLGYAADDNA